jgi:hypothetical protein
VILTDGIHLVSTVGLDELHAFADRISLKRCWFDPRSDHPHYDLTTAPLGSGRQVLMEERAVRNGAQLVSSKELVARMRRPCQHPVTWQQPK